MLNVTSICRLWLMWLCWKRISPAKKRFELKSRKYIIIIIKDNYSGDRQIDDGPFKWFTFRWRGTFCSWALPMLQILVQTLPTDIWIHFGANVCVYKYRCKYWCKYWYKYWCKNCSGADTICWLLSQVGLVLSLDPPLTWLYLKFSTRWFDWLVIWLYWLIVWRLIDWLIDG